MEFITSKNNELYSKSQTSLKNKLFCSPTMIKGYSTFNLLSPGDPSAGRVRLCLGMSSVGNYSEPGGKLCLSTLNFIIVVMLSFCFLFGALGFILTPAVLLPSRLL